MHTRRDPGRTPGFGVIAVACALAVAACSSPSSRPTTSKDPVGDAQRSLTAQRSSRVAGSVTTRGKRAALTGAWSGDLASGTGRAAFTIDLAGGSPGAAEIRWVRGTGYLRRVAATDAARAGAGTLGLLLRAASDRPWAKVATVSLPSLLMMPFDPPAILGRLASSRPRARPGTTKIDGQAAVDLRSTQPVPIVGWWTDAVIDAFVGPHDRVLRIRVTAGDGGLEYDLIDAGTTVAVATPPAAEIAPPASAPTVALRGPYTVVRAGTTDGVAWKLLRAPATGGNVCWRWAAIPPVGQLLVNRPDGAHCVVPPTAGTDAENTVQFVVNTVGNSSYTALAVTLPPGVRRLTLGFVGGTVRSVPVASPFVLVSPRSPVPGYLGVVLADGTQLACGAGAIGSIRDLRDSTLTSGAAGAPWVCIAAP